MNCLRPLVRFTREDYARIRDACSDLPETFDEWEAAAGRAAERLLRAGFIPCEVTIGPAELQAWAKGRPITARMRDAYAALLMVQLEDGWLN